MPPKRKERAEEAAPAKKQHGGGDRGQGRKEEFRQHAQAGRRRPCAAAEEADMGANGMLASVLAALLCCTVVCVTCECIHEIERSLNFNLYNTDYLWVPRASRAPTRGDAPPRSGPLSPLRPIAPPRGFSAVTDKKSRTHRCLLYLYGDSTAYKLKLLVGLYTWRSDGQRRSVERSIMTSAGRRIWAPVWPNHAAGTCSRRRVLQTAKQTCTRQRRQRLNCSPPAARTSWRTCSGVARAAQPRGGRRPWPHSPGTWRRAAACAASGRCRAPTGTRR